MANKNKEVTTTQELYIARLAELRELQIQLDLSGNAVEAIRIGQQLADLADTPPDSFLPYIDPDKLDDPTDKDNAGAFNVASLLGVYPPARRRRG